MGGWWHRAAGILGTVVLTTVAVVVANYPAVQQAFALVPFLGNPAPVVLSGGGGGLWLVIWTTLAVVVAALWPLYKPRPRRILDTLVLAQKRVLLAMIGLAALGYFKWSHRLPRSTLMLTTVGLLVALPAWFLLVRRQPARTERAVIVGDDPAAMQDIVAATDASILGYVSPPSSYVSARETGVEQVRAADGGVVERRLDTLPCLGGLSRFDEVLVDHDVDTALLAFAETDRGEFFGALDACAEHGVQAMVHRDHADDVLTAEQAGGDLLEVDLEPWDWQDYVVKRVFDVALAGLGLLVLSPVIAVIAAAIKLDSPGPVLYSQDRTAEFGETFTVYKFRSMIPEAEADTGATLSEEDAGEHDPRVTRVGRILRKTHLDEVPQLWSILVGDMSVVGPRPERPELDTEMEIDASEWRSRWFVKPGLTGLAQINDATGHDPDEKLRYDIRYIRRQSFWFDIRIVIRQVWRVVIDCVGFVVGREVSRE
jgi:exopolysaccharide biosynthesis polyprenyl glycosylphosphotransferase